MQDDVIIKVNDLSKEFKLPHEKNTSVKSMFVNFYKRDKSYELQQALKDVSFEIKKGEFFGIVGRNGSGKSTLLKILAGVYVSTKGQVEVRGKLTPFIELGVGFNPELTGRENVYLNGALLGFNRKEMRAMYKNIVEFAELERFMDQKLKNYSSGMQVRLAFSIAIQAKNDILIFDEVLAVGDEAFQRKCLDIFEKYKADKQTVVLVTHDMETVRKFCSRAMLINDGAVIDIGNPRMIADKYTEINIKAIEKGMTRTSSAYSNKKYIHAQLLDMDNKPKRAFSFGQDMIIDIKLNDIGAEDFESVGVHIFKLSGEHVTGINSRTKANQSWKSKGHLRIKLPLKIMPGKYYVLVELFEKEGRAIDSLIEGLQFTVAETEMEWSGLIELPHTWVED